MKYSKVLTALTLSISSCFTFANNEVPVTNAFIADYDVQPYYMYDNYRNDVRYIGELPLYGDVMNFDRVFENVGDFEWQKTRDNTETGNTGPKSSSFTNHLSGNYYWYFETSPNFANKKGDTAVLEGAEFNTKNALLTFDYHMFGRDIGHLSVQALVNGQWQTLWVKGGQQQNQYGESWRTAHVPLDSLNTERTKLRFQAVANGGAKGDIALDNIEIKSSAYDNRINITYAHYNSSYDGNLTWEWPPIDGVEPEAPYTLENLTRNTPWQPKNDKYSYSQFIIGTNANGDKQWFQLYESLFFNPYPIPFLRFYQSMSGWEICEGLGEDVWDISIQIWDDKNSSTASETPVLGTIDCTFN